MNTNQNSDDLRQLAFLATEHEKCKMDDVFKRQWFKSTTKKQISVSLPTNDAMAVNSLLILSYKDMPNKWELIGYSTCSVCCKLGRCYRLVPTKRTLCIGCWVSKSSHEELLHVVIPTEEFVETIRP